MTLNDINDLPLPNLQALIARHGTIAVGLAYLRAALTRRSHPPDQSASEILSDHLLRDIGLPTRERTAKTGRNGWDF